MFRCRPGTRRPLFWERQLDIVSRHVEDARAKGASILVGGQANTGNGLFYRPTVVVNLTHDMDLMSEETFGPGLEERKHLVPLRR